MSGNLRGNTFVVQNISKKSNLSLNWNGSTIIHIVFPFITREETKKNGLSFTCGNINDLLLLGLQAISHGPSPLLRSSDVSHLIATGPVLSGRRDPLSISSPDSGWWASWAPFYTSECR